MSKRTPPCTWIDWLLVAAIVALSLVLLWPSIDVAIEAWQNRPRPGVQVCQQFVPKADGQNEALAVPVDYLLYLPQEYDTSHKWPLVIYLHGSGERGHDVNIVRRLALPRQIDEGEQFPFILACPQCPADSRWIPEQVVKLIEDISNRFPVDRDRVYLTGSSMGGFGTWATASYEPGRFAAIVPLCGGGDLSQAERLKDLPIWAFHGAEDQLVPLETSKTMVDAVRKCGGHVQFTVYPNYDHGIWDVAYRDKRLYEWLLAQRRSRHSLSSSQEEGGRK